MRKAPVQGWKGAFWNPRRVTVRNREQVKPMLKDQHPFEATLVKDSGPVNHSTSYAIPPWDFYFGSGVMRRLLVDSDTAARKFHCSEAETQTGEVIYATLEAALKLTESGKLDVAESTSPAFLKAMARTIQRRKAGRSGDPVTTVLNEAALIPIEDSGFSEVEFESTLAACRSAAISAGISQQHVDAVLLSAQGKETVEIAKALSCKPDTVRKWKARFTKVVAKAIRSVVFGATLLVGGCSYEPAPANDSANSSGRNNTLIAEISVDLSQRSEETLQLYATISYNLQSTLPDYAVVRINVYGNGINRVYEGPPIWGRNEFNHKVASTFEHPSLSVTTPITRSDDVVALNLLHSGECETYVAYLVSDGAQEADPKRLAQKMKSLFRELAKRKTLLRFAICGVLPDYQLDWATWMKPLGKRGFVRGKDDVDTIPPLEVR